MRELFSKYGFFIDDEIEDKLNRYFHLLKDWNSRINLTAVTEYNEVIRKHFLDSVLLMEDAELASVRLIKDCVPVNFYRDDSFVLIYDRYSDLLSRKSLHVLDVGSGAGFPGLVLAIFYPEWDITLLEPIQKRVDFLHAVVSELSLGNVKVIRGRSETLGHDPDHREKYDLVVSRAVAEMRVLFELCLPFVSPEGFFVSYKGPQFSDELAASGHALKELNANCFMSFDYSLEGMSRSLVIVERTGEMPDRYPRRDGIPLKRPL